MIATLNLATLCSIVWKIGLKQIRSIGAHSKSMGSNVCCASSFLKSGVDCIHFGVIAKTNILYSFDTLQNILFAVRKNTIMIAQTFDYLSHTSIKIEFDRNE